MDTKKIEKVFFPELLQAIKFMWAFFNYDTDSNGFLIDRELREGLTQITLPLPFNAKERNSLNECLQFLSFGGSYRLTLKEFLDFMFYN
jgi:Ca2+-binding EF-hand superfamily protein